MNELQLPRLGCTVLGGLGLDHKMLIGTAF